jgi:hypothetical protein
MPTPKISDLTNCFNQLLEIELNVVLSTAKQATKDKDDVTFLMSQSYVMGLQRAADIFNIVVKDIKDE